MKTYRGIPPHGVMVDIDEGGKRGYIGSYGLSLRLDLRNHSPTGFSWGYGGSGPAQLALALLADVLGDVEAERLYMRFKSNVIAKLPGDQPWTLTSQEIVDAALLDARLEPGEDGEPDPGQRVEL